MLNSCLLAPATPSCTDSPSTLIGCIQLRWMRCTRTSPGKILLAILLDVLVPHLLLIMYGTAAKRSRKANTARMAALSSCRTVWNSDLGAEVTGSGPLLPLLCAARATPTGINCLLFLVLTGNACAAEC